MSYAAQELAKRAKARAKDWAEPALRLPLSDELAELLCSRRVMPLSRPETATLRDLLSDALDRAVGRRK